MISPSNSGLRSLKQRLSRGLPKTTKAEPERKFIFTDRNIDKSSGLFTDRNIDKPTPPVTDRNMEKYPAYTDRNRDMPLKNEKVVDKENSKRLNSANACLQKF